MIDITCAILSMNVHFDKKQKQNGKCKIPSDSNARNITLYCEFSNAVLGHAIRTLPDMNEKTQSYIFTSGSRRLPAPRPLQINMEIGVLFSYCHERPSDLTMACKAKVFFFCVCVVWWVWVWGGGYSVRFRIGMILNARLETLQRSTKGVETIHFAQFWWKIGVEIRHFPHFC